jgi:hypothetical protein
MAFTAGQKILDPCPLVVSQSKALHGVGPSAKPTSHQSLDN